MSVTGNIQKMMQLFLGTRKANDAGADSFVREDALNNLYSQSKLIAVMGNHTIVHLSNGDRVMLERKEQLINITYLPNTSTVETLDVIEFWMNASSLATLEQILRSLPSGDFDTMLIN